jgi:S1-C subfamily serine protease
LENLKTPADVTMRTMPFIAVTLLTALSVNIPCRADESVPGVERSVVKVNVTKRGPDYFRPWAKANPSKSSGSGVVIAGRRILTNAHVVNYASEVLVQLRQGGDQLAAKVSAVAPGIDLAVIELNEPDKLGSLAPLSLADELPQPKSNITVFGYPAGGDDLSVTDGIVSRIEFTDYYFETVGVRIQVDAALNPGNSGGPAIQDGKIAGLVFSKIQEAENIGYLIPPEEIQDFLSDASDGHYDGKRQLFDFMFSTENKALREYLEIPDGMTGVVVGNLWHPRDDYPLKKWDVVTHIGPHAIDNQGYVDVRDGLRLKFLYYVQKLQSDGYVELSILRDGKSQVVRVPVTAKRDYLIYVLKDQYPEYFIYGPLVFTAASQEFVRSLAGAGGLGIQYLLAINSPLMARLFDPPEYKDEQLVVIATRMFPHPITKGYGNRPFGVVAKLNGTKVKNLRHLAELLRDCSDDFVRFEMADRSESLVFRRRQIEAATEEILGDEGIRYQASEQLRDVWKNGE